MYCYIAIYCIYADFPSQSNGTVGSNNNTNSLICNVTNDDNDTIFITSTIDVMITSSVINHTPVTTNATNSSDLSSSRPVIAYPVILSSVAGGLLGLCFIVCIVGLLLKRKLNRKHIKTNTFSPVNSLFYRYTNSVCSVICIDWY